MNRDQAQYFGKYRGTVVNTTDPEQRARLRAVVPDVLGTEPTTWALPAAPYSGNAAGFVALPPVGAGVWIEFEQGNRTIRFGPGGGGASPRNYLRTAPQPGSIRSRSSHPDGMRS
jgi:Type VI secretion system/phage-baseplate injector OB domain